MDGRDRQNLAVALVVLVLIGVGYWLMIEMRYRGRLEECLMQRRRDCQNLTR